MDDSSCKSGQMFFKKTEKHLPAFCDVRTRIGEKSRIGSYAAV